MLLVLEKSILPMSEVPMYFGQCRNGSLKLIFKFISITSSPSPFNIPVSPIKNPYFNQLISLVSTTAIWNFGRTRLARGEAWQFMSPSYSGCAAMSIERGKLGQVPGELFLSLSVFMFGTERISPMLKLHKTNRAFFSSANNLKQVSPLTANSKRRSESETAHRVNFIAGGERKQ